MSENSQTGQWESFIVFLMKQDDVYYKAMLARDARFDGKFFVGVKTTRIYCRPICPAKPKRENVEFFRNSFDAEKSGYRPCMRCRPESAPLSQAWIGKSAVVRRAVKILNSQEPLDFDENYFAAQFGMTARHLRRLFVAEIGKTPKQISFENRLNLARKLIVETQILIADIAFASGFSSIRRFNDAFKDRFRKTPSEIRRKKSVSDKGINITLSYRPPFDFAGIIQSYQNHRVGNLEWFIDGKMYRVITFDQKVGCIAISNNEDSSTLSVEIDFPDTSAIHKIIARVRVLFDLDSDPAIVANTLETDPKIKKLLKKYPGVRIPTGWDPFEIAVSTILGQLVSVERGRSLVQDLIAIAGEDCGSVINGHPVRLFPTPEQIVEADLTKLKTTGNRKVTLKEFSKAVLEKRISLEPTQDVETFIKKVLSIRGIGIWTASYMALKVLRDTDTFPATDLILGRALAIHSIDEVNKMRPWRGYVAALFWRNYAKNSDKSKFNSRSTLPRRL